MRIIANTNSDALLALSHLLKANRHMVVDRVWAPDGSPTKKVNINIDCDRDEVASIAANVAGTGCQFAMEVDV